MSYYNQSGYGQGPPQGYGQPLQRSAEQHVMRSRCG